MRGTRTFPLKDNLPTDRLPIVTILLIVANVLVYVFIRHGDVTSGPDDQNAVELLTSMFLHDGIVQLLINMLFLWLFGASVEDSMSRPRFVLFYLLGGLAAIGVQVLVEPNSTVPAIGASGAIAAVLGGYILLYPRARAVTAVLVIFASTLIELPMWMLLVAWFVLQAIVAATSLADVAGGGVAYVADVGGFVFGLLAIKLFAQRRKQVPQRAGEVLL